MRGYLISHDDTVYALPLLTEWQVRHTNGNGCDSFEVTFVYDPKMKPMLDSAVRFYGEHSGKRVFYGIVDEYEIDLYDKCTVTLSGRGMGGLLLDNEAAAAEFYVCRLNDVLDRYVFPLGIDIAECSEFSAVYGYDVTSGSSCMKALSGYTEKSSGVIPRFSKEGKLVLNNDSGRTLRITAENGIFDVYYKKQRYGIVSEVEVKTVTGKTCLVKNEEFTAAGGKLKQVMMVPKNTSLADMRYKGKSTIDASKEGKTVLRMSLPALFAAEPCDKVLLDAEKLGLSGSYWVTETVVWADKTSCGTRIYMKSEE